MQFKYSYLRTSSCMARKYTLYTNQNLLFWQTLGLIVSLSDCLHLNYQVTPIHKKVTRHIVQFMICIDKGRAKKKEKKTTISWKTVTQCIRRVVLFVTLGMICPFFHENHGVKTTERKLYERIIRSKTKLKSRHATNPCFVQGWWHNNNGFSVF